MPNITLPDGKKISFKNKVTGLELAEKISKSLAKQALIISVNGELKDLSFSIQKDSSVKIITNNDKEGLDVIRHDAAHIMAMAVQELFPGTQVTIGPVIENGFYFDFARKEPFTEDDLKKIEKKMSEIIDRDVKSVCLNSSLFFSLDWTFTDSNLFVIVVVLSSAARIPLPFDII